MRWKLGMQVCTDTDADGGGGEEVEVLSGGGVGGRREAFVSWRDDSRARCCALFVCDCCWRQWEGLSANKSRGGGGRCGLTRVIVTVE